MRRVVITGMSAISPIGSNWQTIAYNLKHQIGGVSYQPEWEKYKELNAKLAAPVTDFEKPAHLNRKVTRSMSRVSLLSVTAAERALEDAGLRQDPIITSGIMGIAFGSSAGSTDAIREFGNMLENYDIRGINATTYIRMMSHTAAVNMGVYFGLTGRIIPTSSACTSGSQGIGYAYETIKHGYQELMLAGGAEELCPSEVAVFDTLFATSRLNEHPELTPKPFDKDRDGLVIGEGAGVLVLEEYEHAKTRGATIYAEILGFACNSDGKHITQPNIDTMQIVMEKSLADAQLKPADIGYVNAHGTATEHGDIAETNATENIFGKNIPISSLKSYMGHTLGACGALETIFSINMMNEGWFSPTRNLTNVDPRCGQLDYIRGDIRRLDSEKIMTNNFAFGGINTSIILQRAP